MSSDHTTETRTEARSKRKIPILVWIIVAAFVAWAAFYFLQRGGQYVSPQGGDHPVAAQSPAVAPAAPATPEAPATPQSTVGQ
jgi:hypothetical protein